MIRTYVVIAALFAVTLVGCATEPRDHADVAREIRDDLRELAEAVDANASQDEVERRIMILIEKSDLLVDSACTYDDILKRFRAVYDEFAAISQNPERETLSDDPSFFTARGIETPTAPDTRGFTSYRPPVQSTPAPTTRATEPVETPEEAAARRQRKIEEDANNNISEELAGVLARARLAEQELLDPLGDPREEDSDE